MGGRLRHANATSRSRPTRFRSVTPVSGSVEHTTVPAMARSAAVVELPWVLAVRDDDPLAGRSHVDVTELGAIRLVRLPRNSTSANRLDATLAELGIRIGSDTSVADWDTALLLVELGLGHALVPALPGWQVPGDDGPLRLVPVSGLSPLPVGWAVRRWDALPPLARVFADRVAQHCVERGEPRPAALGRRAVVGGDPALGR